MVTDSRKLAQTNLEARDHYNISMKPFLIASLLLLQLALAQYEATANERLYYRGTLNDATFQLELMFNGDTLTGRGYDEQGNNLSLSGNRDTTTNTVIFQDANTYNSYLAAFAYDYDSKTYFLNGMRISSDGANEPFTLRLIATYNSVSFKSGSLESTLIYPLWLGNYKTFNQIGTENFQDTMVNLAYNYFKEQQNLPVLEGGYENEAVSRNAVTEIYFASPEFISLLVYENSYDSVPIKSVNILLENGTTKKLELSDLVSDLASLKEKVSNDLKSQTENEDIALSDQALNIFTVSPTGLSFHVPTAELELPYTFENSFTVKLSLDTLGDSINPNILELLR
jgi:hypothetical protein